MDNQLSERRVAAEAIFALVKLKNVMASRILEPAGVSRDLYGPIMRLVDETTGRPLSKRKMAPLIVEAAFSLPDGPDVIRRIVRIAADWTSFDLSQDEHEARATVMRARDVLGIIEAQEARETAQREAAWESQRSRLERERAERISKESNLLLMMFDALAVDTDHHIRGHLLEELLNRMFEVHGIDVFGRFVRNSGGEQIDGSFRLDGWHYLVECKWRQKLSDTAELDSLKGKIGRSGKQTMGLFLSINGWSANVPGLLKQNPDKSIILMEGYGLRTVLGDQLDLEDFVKAMVAHLNFRAEPFLPVSEYLSQHRRDRSA